MPTQLFDIIMFWFGTLIALYIAKKGKGRKMNNWIKELKQARDDARIELAKLDLNTMIGMQRAGELMLAIGEINTSIIAAQEKLINELTEQKVA